MLRAELVRPLPVLLRQHAERRGDAVAFLDDDRSVTYGDLERRTARLGGHLVTLGLARGDRAVIMLDNRVEVVESYLAVVRAAGIVVPVNPRLTAPELQHVLRDSDARVLITDAAHLRQLGPALSGPDAPAVLLVDPAGPDPALDVVSFDELVAHEPPQPPPDDLALDEPAFMLYTSGTTGLPKAVRSTQRAALWSVAAGYVPALGLSERDRLLWPVPMFHSLAHVLCIVGVTAVGASARLLPGFSAEDVVAELRGGAHTVLVGVPAMYRQLVRAAAGALDAPALRLCLSGGTVLPAELLRAVEDSFGVPVVDNYGSTETSGAMATTWHTGSRPPGSCGLPVPGLSMRLVDPDTGADVPPGAEGEVWVSGPSVMLGYHGQPAATTEVLVDGWYRTGDLASRDELGFLTIRGRIRELIIRGGENMHPGEIEHVVRAVDGVADAAVVGEPDDELGEVPVAYLVPAAPGAFDPAGVLAACRRALAGFKVPVRLYEVPDIPRTGSGKIIRHRLRPETATLLVAPQAAAAPEPAPAPMPTATSNLHQSVAARPDTEARATLLDLVTAEVAGVLGDTGAPVPPDTSLTELGVDSRMAVQLRDRLGRATGTRLPVGVAFSHPTPRALADHLLDGLRGRTARRATARTGPADEPIAIVGMSCHLPGGVRSPDELWRLLAAGGEAIGAFPADRGWDVEGIYDPDPARAGRTYVRRGGFLDGAAYFDADFFGISPREALAIDPQQRLLLEAAWEALERAGIEPRSLRGSPTGVFAGVMFHDYTARPGATSAEAEGYLTISGAASVVSGRIAYTLGLTGPAVTVDTACSSSLVALHLAVQALRQGECSLAVAGGVSVMATPDVFIGASRQRALAADGRCKAFSADADGTVFAEGVGVLVVERLSDARRNGHEVLAVVRGSAVNQDGASNGLTAPNGDAQQEVIRQALTKARLSVADVDVVEAHGTGTRLGDAIEAEALMATYGSHRSPGAPLYLGSVKSNIGHTQAAAGVVGVIKMVLALRHGVLPRTLHADRPLTDVDWSAGTMELLATPVAWPAADRPRRAAVSSFGVSGTNAHVIVEEAARHPAERPATPGPGGPGALLPLLLSGRTESALRDQARRLAERLAAPDAPGVAGVASALAGRTTFEHRAAALGADRPALLAGLDALAGGAPHAGVVQGRAGADATRVVFVFPGQGSQWAGMGVELLDSSPVFAEKVAACAAALAPHIDWSVEDVLRQAAGAPPMSRLDVVQPVLFTMMVALAELWRSHGIEPAAVVGHSQGEIAAAHVAGGLTLDDAARVVALRSRAWMRLQGRGSMLSVLATAGDVTRRMAAWGDRVSLAALNGPASVAVSGDVEALTELLAALSDAGIRARWVPGADGAGHSAQVDVLRAEILENLASLAPHPSEVPFFSSVTGDRLDTAALDGEYWFRNMREMVRFEPVVRRLDALRHGTFIEVSPHPVLVTAVQETLEATAGASRPAVLGTLRRDDGSPARMLTSLAEAHTNGVPVAWQRILGDAPAGAADLPTYPFQRQRFWLPSRPGGSAAGPAAGHPLLDAVVDLAGDGGLVFTGRLSAAERPWLAEHVVMGVPLLPGAALVDLALHAGDRLGCPRLEELVFEVPLVLPEQGALQLQIACGGADDAGHRAVTVHTRPDGDTAAWVRHATGTLAPARDLPAAEPGRWPPAGAVGLPVDGCYERLAAAGIEYGPAFQGLRAAWRLGTETYAEVALPAEAADATGYGLHPALLDAALQATQLEAAGAGGRLAFSWSGVTLHATGATTLRVRLSARDRDTVTLTATDERGRPVVTADALTLRPASAEQLRTAGVDGGLFDVDWQPADPVGPAPADWVVIGGESGRHPDLTALGAALEDGSPMPGLVLVPLTGGPWDGEPATVRATVDATARLLRQWLRTEAFGSARLAVVTRAAVAVGAAEPVDPVGAAVWGLVRCAQVEHPDRFVLVDVDTFDAVAAARAAAGAEPQRALRGSTVFDARLVPVRPDDRTGPVWDPAGTVLVTGGTGGLGRHVARHLVAGHGIRHLLLVSRRGPAAPGADELVAELAGLGAEVSIVACDVADAGSLAEVLAALPADRPLRGIVHAAGVVADAVVENLTAERVDEVCAPKVDAATHLYEQTRHADLTAVVLFSSAAAVLGAGGQGGYAAANAFLDALAHRWRGEGTAVVALGWGMWAEDAGMGGQVSSNDVRRLERAGTAAISPPAALALLDSAAHTGRAALLPLRLARAALAEQARAGTLPPLLRGLVRTAVRGSRPGSEAAGSTLAGRLAGLPDAVRRHHLVDLVRRHAAAVLGHPTPDTIVPDRPFKELGIDSLTAVELRNQLRSATGLPLGPTTVFDHPTVASLATRLEHLLGLADGTADVAEPGTTAAPDEPIAIVGMACRLPGGVDSPEELWRMLVEGRDAVTGLPTDRGWDLEALFDEDPDAPGKSYVRHGGFIDGVAGFDAEFFGISPREALAMDPQQRLLLEASWEALERAGIDPLSLRGSQTGVFVGTSGQDYTPRADQAPEQVEGYLATSGLSSVLSGRVSYVLGLEGPAVTVDTACSSSLVALHLAVQSLRRGECDVALVAGASVMSSPAALVTFSRQRGLAPDGRCKPFAAAADGFGVAEGVGVLVLQRSSVARRALAVVRGSAVNQDGASNGLTAPSGPAQERVLRLALGSAGLGPGDVDVVEGHGTGTRLGDPIEVGALLEVFGGRAGAPVLLGSVKSNIGHTQAAAGVVGVMKMVLALRAGVVPASLHVDEPSPVVDWSAGGVEVVRELVDWPEVARPRRAGVSSFGISGTNAHVILEQGPVRPEPETQPAAGPVAWPLAARTEDALRDLAARLAEFLAGRELRPQDVGRALATTRPALRHRAVVVASDPGQLRAGLAAVADGQSAKHVVRGAAGTAAAKVVFVFPGQGSQWQGMGRHLMDTAPVFAGTVRRCAEAMAEFVDWDLERVLRGEDPLALQRVDVVQPATFAVVVSLAALWRSCGVEPAAVIGHSQGEIAAATVAGVLSLRDACRIVTLRSQALRAIAGSGGMVSVALPEPDVRALVSAWGDRIGVAAVNGPTSAVVSGDAAALDELLVECERRGIRARRIAVDYASHSPAVEQIRDEVLALSAPVTAHRARAPMMSTVDVGWVGGAELDAGYWYRNLREVVRFDAAVDALLSTGHDVFVEVSAHPTMTIGIEDRSTAAGVPAAVLGTLRRDEGDRFPAAVAEAWAAGVPVDWTAVLPAGDVVELPTYPFQRDRYWLETPAQAGDAGGLGLDDAGHPLLGAVVRPAGTRQAVFTGQLSRRTDPWLAEHVIGGAAILPGAALVELALHAGQAAGCTHLDELVLLAPVPLTGAAAVHVQLAVAEPDDAGRCAVTVHTRPAGAGEDEPWTHHASGTLSRRLGGAPPDPVQWPPAAASSLSTADFYADLACAGTEYGESFQGLHAAWRHEETVFADVRLPEALHRQADRYGVHPVLLDAALHAVTLLHPVAGQRLAFTWSGVTLHRSGATALTVRLTRTGTDAVAVSAVDPAGHLVLTVDSLVTRPATTEQGPRGLPRDALFRIDWMAMQVDGALDELPVELPAGGVGALAAELDAGRPAPSTVFTQVASAHGESLADQVRTTTRAALGLIQAWLAEQRLAGTRLVFVTGGAVALQPGAPIGDLAAAALHGLVRSAQSEHPGRFVLLDTDEPTAAAVAAAVHSGEPQVAVRGGTYHAARLVRTDPPATMDATFDASDIVLITGATGGLGRLAARHLVRAHGVGRVVLASRRGPDADGAAELAAELTASGAAVTLVACDIADRDALAGLLAEHPITAVVHTAGVVDDAVVENLTPEQLDRVFAPKVDAATNLDELTAGLPLKAFVLYSAAAATFGNAGQAAYAAANSFLDALAQHRAALGRPAISLAWGLWAEEHGMGSRLGALDVRRALDKGTAPLSVEDGLALLDAALTLRLPALAPVRLDLGRLRRTAAAAPVPHLLRQLVRVPAGPAASGPAGASTLAQRLAGLAADERDRTLRDLVRRSAAEVLGHDSADRIRPDRPLRELGFDSLTAVELRNRLGAATGLALPTTLVFDCPTVTAIADELWRRMSPASGTAPAATPTRPHSEDEPIAIVGMACRLPGGVTSPEQLWQLLIDEVDAITPVPAGRGWHVDDDLVRHGGFIDDVAGFDAGLFGISPREALAMDPQQRLLLETSWEAFERAGIAPLSLQGSQTGVFIGSVYQDYADRAAGVPEDVELYVGNGSAASIASGRIAYTLGLEGPAVTVDTACSSSLVALHLAVQALRRGECDLALAGGATVMSTPAALAEMGRQGGLSADGRCKAFGEGADGAGLAEGVGMLVLQRLSAARRPLAVVRGSAVNQDGASNGLTAPSGRAQERVLRLALGSAGLGVSDVDVVEGHGTGTRLGDPIEVGALLEVFGGRAGAPVLLGSVKSNIGHTQAAAGVVGVMKMVLALRAGVVPASLHARELSPVVDWSAGGVEVVRERVDWPEVGRARRAGVSSFGISGTNAHVILEQAPEIPAVPISAAPPGGPALLPLSAPTPAALRDQAARLHAYLTHTGEPALHDVGWSLATTRGAFEHRAAVAGADRAAVLADLDAIATGATAGTTALTDPRAVFVFPGQGSQWVGMAVELLESSVVFAEWMGLCGVGLGGLVDWDLLEVVRGGVGLDRVDVVQPVSFAVMVSLAAVWRSFGVEPVAVVGHSQGEIAAAVVAGVLSLVDGCRVVVLRSRALVGLAGSGGMVSVGLPVGEVEELVAGFDGRLSTAAVNGPASVVLSGGSRAVEELLAQHGTEGGRVRRIAVDYASHSPAVEQIRDEVLTALAPVRPQSPTVPMYSTVDNRWVEAGELTAEYWYRNLREQVRFADATTSLIASGHNLFIEVSSHPVLTTAVADTAEAGGATVHTLGTLRRQRGDLDQFLVALGQAWSAGAPVDWPRVHPGATRVDLPTYAFQHRRYWLDIDPATQFAGDRFWSAVARADAGALGAMLGVAPEPLRHALPALSALLHHRTVPAPAPEPDEERAEEPADTLLARLAGASEQEQRRLLVELVRDHAAAVLRHERPDDVATSRRFLDIGFDSVTAVELRNRLASATGLALPSTLLFDHPTATALATHLRRRLAGSPPRSEAPPATAERGEPLVEDEQEIDAMAVDDLLKLVHESRER
ncbi:SDR family NAD(P)-dependent oxidoreductase [Dactylosporangium sp. CA-152071]|uniref:SDR family NAD(P)-dependent oxidoreductase n=1 Tax=Dactylosporangium sp. CA-152071 TaxID=3239933 RepID=UPI003D8BBFCE